MSDLDTLRQMIREEAQISLEQDAYGNSILNLTETQCQDSSVTIHKMPDQSVVISVDEFWSVESMFTHEMGQCKRADFIIVADIGTKKVIIYIEMKRTHAETKTVIQQLTGASCFIAFCREIARSSAFWDKGDFLKDYEKRFVYLYETNTSINKRPTRINPEQGIHNSPERMLKLKAPGYLTLQRLIY
jgi:hypothetical protein